MALAARRNGDEMGVAAVDRAVRTGSGSRCSGVAGTDGVACVWSGCAIVHDFLGGRAVLPQWGPCFSEARPTGLRVGRGWALILLMRF